MSTNYNLENWPIVYFKPTNNKINDESFEDYKKMYLSLLVRCKKNKEQIILICNLDNSCNLPLNFVIKQAKFNKEINKFNKEYIKSVCILCKDNGIKNILNLYFTICKPVVPYKLCRSFNKINKYLMEKHDISFNSNVYDENYKIEDIMEEIVEEEEPMYEEPSSIEEEEEGEENINNVENDTKNTYFELLA